MKTTFFAFLLFVSPVFAQLNVRQIDRVVDVSQNSQVPTVEWYKGESVKFNAYLWRLNERVSLPSTALPVLKAWKGTDLSVLYVNSTGTLLNAGSGEVSVSLTPSQANLPSNSYSFAMQLWDGTNYMGVAAAGTLRVIASPAGDSIAYVGTSSDYGFIRGPTNGWTSGYLLTSTDGGTSTFAVASNAITNRGVRINGVVITNGAVVTVQGISGDLSTLSNGLASVAATASNAETTAQSAYAAATGAQSAASAVFAGQDTTGAVTSTGGDAGKYLKADGSWDSPPDNVGFVSPATAALEMGAYPVTFSQPIPNSPGTASLYLSATNFDDDPWPIIKLTGVYTTQFIDFGLDLVAPAPSNNYVLTYTATDSTWRAKAASGGDMMSLSNGLINVGLTATNALTVGNWSSNRADSAYVAATQAQAGVVSVGLVASNAYARGDTSGLNWAAISNAPANITTQGTITAASIGAVTNGGATVNGSAITNGAAITISAGVSGIIGTEGIVTATNGAQVTVSITTNTVGGNSSKMLTRTLVGSNYVVQWGDSVSTGTGQVNALYYTNKVVFNVLASTTTADQAWTVPAGVTSIYVKAMGAGGAGLYSQGGGGNGGFAAASLSVTQGEELIIKVGQGGKYFSDARTSYKQLPGGGWCNSVSNNANSVANGGGYSGVFRGTNILIIAGAGGGGGKKSYSYGGWGGGSDGLAGYSANGTNIWYGGGGSQTNGGIAYSNNTNLYDSGYGTWSNYLVQTAGSFLQGGNCLYNSQPTGAGFSDASGGGGGYYGGAGYDKGNTPSNEGCSSGGGSSFVPFGGYTTSIIPYYDVDYQANTGSGGGSSADGQPGFVVIRYNQ